MHFDIERCLKDAGITFKKSTSEYKTQPCTKFALDYCFFNSTHFKNDACIFQYKNGGIVYKCLHESCKNKIWNDARDYLTKNGIELENYWPDKPINNTSIAENRDISYMSFQDIHDNPVEMEPLIKGFLYKNESCLIHAPGGVGKSLIVLYISLYLASYGTDETSNSAEIFGKFFIPEKRASLFIQAENSISSMNIRIITMCKGNPVFKNGLKRQFVLSQHEDTTLTGERFSDPGFCQFLVDYIGRLEKEMGLKIDLLIIDPLISYHGGNENDSVETRATLDGITSICTLAGCTPILVHHDSKGSQGTGYSYRGSTAINDWARSRISLSTGNNEGKDTGRKLLKVVHEKCNNFERFDSFWLEMDSNLNFCLVEPPIKQKDIDACENVVKVLSKIGGTAESKNKLAEVYKQDYRGSPSTAKRNIEKAVKHGFITERKITRDGKDTYEYTIPEK